jgi:hypothetical protein
MHRDSRDRRSKRQKLLDVIHGRGVTDGERHNARTLLAKHDASRGNPETPGRATRESAKAAPGQSGRGRGVRIRYPNGTWVHLDEADVDWHMVDAHRLRYRFDGDTRERMGFSDPDRFYAMCTDHDEGVRFFYSRAELIQHLETHVEEG